MTGIKHIVWDWNGTLLDDNHANLSAVNEVCGMFGRDPVDLEHWRSIFRRPLVPCYEELIGRGFADGEWERANTAYDRHYAAALPRCSLAQGVPGVLHDWAATGRTQSLLSMASHEHLVPLIAERGLSAHFTRVDGRRFDTVDDSKADHLIAHLAGLGADPATVVLIGDIDDDGHAARKAGARAILVASGMMSRERLEATGHPVADTPAEAVRVLRGV
ncbi:HAD family hydrolase [Nocardiopsis mangrovi]|uniref:HAD family hydrolase n=1 Tax=Nocardiopsis mangrovi TaxID=1179818 RepID=A0ABV9DS94_9ACTN